MAGSATAHGRIETTYDGKGVTQAKKGVSSLSDSFKKLTLAAGAITAGIAVVKKISSSVSESVSLFHTQEDADMKLAQSVNNNAKLTTESFKRLKTAASAIQGVSIFGDETLEEQQSVLASMGLTEDQINKTMNAAVDMASSGVMPLNSAVKTLAKTYNGQIGLLSNYSLGVKGLTTDQLKNGDAIEVIAEQYAGMGKTMASTSSGISTQFSNTMGDIEENIGSVFTAIQTTFQTIALPVVNDLGTAIANLSPVIVSIVKKVPIALTGVKNMVKTGFTLKFFTDFFKSVGKTMFQVVKLHLLAIKSLVSVIATVIFEPIKFAVETVFVTIHNLISKAVNFAVDSLNKLIMKVMGNKLMSKVLGFMGKNSDDFKIKIEMDEAKLPKFSDMRDSISKRFSSVEESLTTQLSKVGDAADGVGDSFKDAFGPAVTKMLNGFAEEDKKLALELAHTLVSSGGSGSSGGSNPLDPPDPPNPEEPKKTELEKAFDKISNFFQITSKGFKANFSAISSIFKSGDKSEGFFKSIGDAFTADFSAISNVFQSSYEGISKTVGNAFSHIPSISDMFNGVKDGLSNAYQFSLKGLSGGISGGLGSILPGVLSAFKGLGKLLPNILTSVLSLSSVAQLLSPLQTILTSLMDVIGPVINSILSPLVGILKIIGKTIGAVLIPVLQLVTPIITLISKVFIWSYNTIVRPIMNGIISIFNMVYNAHLAMFNGIVKVLSAISLPTGIKISWSGISVKWKSLSSILGLSEDKHYKDLDDGWVKKIDDGDLTDEGSSSSSSSSSGASASYTAAKDVIINIYYENSYINGDARAIALSIRDEIKSAEELGR